MAATPALVFLVGALLRDRDLRREFNRDSKGVMDRYGLPPGDREILSRLDAGALARAAKPIMKDVVAAIQASVNLAGEFPPESEDYIEPAGTSAAAYPDPELKVFHVRPEKISVKHGDTISSFEFVLTGQSFWREPKLSCRVALGSKPMVVTRTLFGTLRCSRMHVRVSPPGRMKTIPFGRYDVTLSVPNGQSDSTISIMVEEAPMPPGTASNPRTNRTRDASKKATRRSRKA